jgi:hypothetical protein
VQLERRQSIDTKTFPGRNGELKKTVAAAGIKNRQKKGKEKVESAFAFYFAML